MTVEAIGLLRLILASTCLTSRHYFRICIVSAFIYIPKGVGWHRIIMGDVLRAEDVETCKENIQPLREGRRASTLKKIVTTTKSIEDIEKERQYVHSKSQ